MVKDSPIDKLSMVMNYITKYDSSGAKESKIDTVLEFGLLGEYLNGNISLGSDVNLSKKDLGAKELSFLTNLYNNLKSYFIKDQKEQDDLSVVTMDNLEKYNQLYRSLVYSSDLNDDNKKLLDRIQQSLYNFLSENGYDFGDINYNSADYIFIIPMFIKKYNAKNLVKSNTKETLAALEKGYDNKKLEEYAKKYVKDHGISSKQIMSGSVDLGNGKFDKTATQKTNLCWAHASIKSLLLTDKGKELIESNRYYDKNTGVFAIHLQEAEDNGFHDGIYIITPDDIEKEGADLSEGDGDVTAYMIAIKRYFDEVRSNPALSEKMENNRKTVRNVEEGNFSFRFFEILTGTTSSQYNYDNRDFQDGIGNSFTEYLEFSKVIEIVNSKQGAVVLSILGHAISVVGVKDGKLLIQESNNDKESMTSIKSSAGNVFQLVEDGEAPIYELTQDNYLYCVDTIAYLKWNSLGQN